ncbi:hypothetical protein BJ166DRAFT_584988 [Pestalotiopsis sp. NC0098]|nr:hypothetical protein BJ166DRAFT_584988 [Pestalotiopsis sp. NC0098]
MFTIRSNTLRSGLRATRLNPAPRQTVRLGGVRGIRTEQAHDGGEGRGGSSFNKNLPGFVASALAIAAGFYFVYGTPDKAKDTIPHADNSTLDEIKRK